ncbi:peptide chain release factor N(5)-glutamine methyltransferase [Nocardioides sp. CER19]|uniref:peptide chain release factor N(5)-glutamine methyltransferase n=1 Tax=Nocardioides sp. CER19 TaxID=3038538 RepID=UPI00244CCA86|nr:peptide chain release factor N(5)-glutamine methyltransferase [Nocardioides sp. CER19]MDH2415370.1 peptide chain release factor N(5)-glutamine methyltransferase [Nocardioides sp. CER19]
MTEVTRRSLLATGAVLLREGGVASPDHDASVLLAHVLGVSRGALVLVDHITDEQADGYLELVHRRAAREPLQHLTGVAYFRHVELAVGPGVFVPRPETELLAGWAVEQAHRVARETRREPVVVDLCTGSGAIAKSIAAEVPGARVHAVELGEDAYAWAERNLSGSGVDLRHGDMGTAFEDLRGSVDVVVCNPPYIPLTAWESVAAEARDHDPDLALYSGQDGLDAMRVLEQRAAFLLGPGGVVGAEHADEQGPDGLGGGAPAVFAATGRWVDVRDHLDLAGRPRYTTARLAR